MSYTPVTVTPEEQAKKDVVKSIAQLLVQKTPGMASDYKITINHTGSLMAGSMAFAYRRALNDVLQLILKEIK